MAELLRTTETYKVYTEEQADLIIKEAREDNDFELVGSSIKHKNKKSKGEIIDEWILVELKKKFAEERPAE